LVQDGEAVVGAFDLCAQGLVGGLEMQRDPCQRARTGDVEIAHVTAEARGHSQVTTHVGGLRTKWRERGDGDHTAAGENETL